MDAAKALRPLPPGQFCAKENRAMFRAVQIVDKPSVCQRICPTACLRTALALRRRGVPWLRTALRSVCSPLQPFGPPTASDRDGNAFLPQTQAFALQKMPEMTYTPSFLIRASFFRDFVNTLPFYRPSFNKTKNQAQGRLLLPCAWFLLSPSRRCPFKRRRPREFPAPW